MVRLEVGIALGHERGRVTEHLLDLVEGNARLDHETRRGVTQRMAAIAGGLLLFFRRKKWF
jgi:hypothetical protein